MFEIEFKHEARIEILEAYVYYEEIKDGLGDRFVENLKKTFKNIQSAPEHFQVRKETLP